MRVLTQAVAPPAQTPAPPFAGQTFPQTNLPASPQLAYRAAVAQRNELLNQATTVGRTRQEISDQITSGAVKGADLAALQKRLAAMDDQQATIDKALASARAEVARTAGTPGATEPMNPLNLISSRDREFALTAMFIVLVLFPIAFGIARRLTRRASAAVASIPRDLSERLGRLEQSMESVAIEIERIGEGQRFMTNVLVDSVSDRALGAGTMEATPVKPREHVEPLRRD